MSDFVDLITAFPAVVFTAMLAFCVLWWLVATVAGLGDGFDSEPDADGALDDIGDALGISSVPPAIGLTILSFVGWVVSLGVTAGVRAADVEGGLLAVVGVAALVGAFVAGIAVTRPIAKRAAPLFVTELAPSERSVIGAFGRVRSTELDDDDDEGPPGEVVITSGPLQGATFGARARPGGRFVLGQAVHVIDADHVGGRLVVTVDVPPELAP